MTQNETCGVCNHHPHEELVEFDGTLLCERCLSVETTACSRCGDRIWNDDNCGNSGTPLCQSCYDDYYTSCSQCGRLMLNEDAIYHDDTYDYPLCYNCDSRSRSGYAIQDYYYKPTPIFHGDGDRYFGVELEVDDGGESDTSASSVMKIEETAFSVFRHQKCNYGDVLAAIRKEYNFTEKLYDVMISYQNATVTGADIETTWYHCGSQSEGMARIMLSLQRFTLMKRLPMQKIESMPIFKR